MSTKLLKPAISKRRNGQRGKTVSFDPRRNKTRCIPRIGSDDPTGDQVYCDPENSGLAKLLASIVQGELEPNTLELRTLINLYKDKVKGVNQKLTLHTYWRLSKY